MKNLIVFTLLFTAFLFAGISQTYSFKVAITGQGQPMILIPGLTCSGEVWNEAVEKFSDRYECHVLTLPGFAGQPAIKGPFLEQVRDEIISYIDAKNLKNPILMGHSLGGFMSLWIAATKPKIPAKVIVVDAFPFFSAGMNPGVTMKQAEQQVEMLRTMSANQTAEARDAQQPMMLRTMITDEENVQIALKWALASDKGAVMDAMAELMTTDLRGEIKRIKCPVLVLAAWYAGKDYGLTKELILGRHTAQYAKVKKVQIEMAATAKHFIMMDEPDWFFAKLESFFNDRMRE